MKPRLVTFLYILLRDHLPAGIVEEIMVKHAQYEGIEALDEADFESYSNVHLARYAHEISQRLVQR